MQGLAYAGRKPLMKVHGCGRMGGMGSRNVRPPEKRGLTFDHVLSRLEGELQKSRETGAELHNLTCVINNP